MDYFRSLARLPGSHDSQPLERRQRPYLTLPHHSHSDASLRDAAYKAILPANAHYSNRFLRRYAFEALVSRAVAESAALYRMQLRDKSKLWDKAIAEAQKSYKDEIEGRRDWYFRAKERSGSGQTASNCSTHPRRHTAEELSASRQHEENPRKKPRVNHETPSLVLEKRLQRGVADSIARRKMQDELGSNVDENTALALALAISAEEALEKASVVDLCAEACVIDLSVD